MTDTGLEVTKEMRDWSTFIERAIKVNAAEALGMKVVLGTKSCPIPEADIYIMDGSVLNHTPKDDPGALLPALHSRATPLVLLCSGSGAPSCFKKEATKRHPIHLHHPIGPRKLASVFCSALKGELKYIDAQSQSPAQSSGTASPWIKPVPIPAVADGSDIKRELLFPDIKRKPPPPLSLPSRPRIGPTASQPPHTPSSLVEEEKKSASEPTLTVSQLQPTKKFHHLLLVDDNPINIKLLVHVVSKLNHTFVTAANGLEAVQLYKKSLEGEHEQRFDLVFMDISMPVMNGFEATRAIRQLEIDVGVERCRVVALTGLSSEVNRNEATASGCDLFLTKPVKMNTVRGLLDEMGKKEEEGKRKQEISEKKGEDRREEDEGKKGKEGETLDG
jgi:CheY-like chemotaxis protein